MYSSSDDEEALLLLALAEDEENNRYTANFLILIMKGTKNIHTLYYLT